MMIDFGEDVEQCVLGTDRSSAKSIMERRGAGRIRSAPRVDTDRDFHLRGIITVTALLFLN